MFLQAVSGSSSRLFGSRTTMQTSVHDNWIYAQAVDHERCRIVLHTVYAHVEPPEYTDIIFEGVVVHHFEQQNVNDGKNPGNVLFDVVETDPVFILDQYADLLARTKNYGWPMLEYHGHNDLASRLTEGGAKCFEVHGVCGIHGFVFAKSVKFRSRQSHADVLAEEDDAKDNVI